MLYSCGLYRHIDAGNGRRGSNSNSSSDGTAATAADAAALLHFGERAA